MNSPVIYPAFFSELIKLPAALHAKRNKLFMQGNFNTKISYAERVPLANVSTTGLSTQNVNAWVLNIFFKRPDSQ
jgi:hypothetical protein